MDMKFPENQCYVEKKILSMTESFKVSNTLPEEFRSKFTSGGEGAYYLRLRHGQGISYYLTSA